MTAATPGRLAGRLALVTGASRGLGAAAALAFAREGAHVVALARTVGGLEELDDRIRAIDRPTGNQIVTGNVTGNRGFSGPVGYGDAREFRGPSGSSRSDAFIAQSAGTAGAAMRRTDSIGSSRVVVTFTPKLLAAALWNCAMTAESWLLLLIATT